MPYAYEPRPRKGMEPPKHKWGNAYAGVAVKLGGESVGMCPNNIPKDVLEQLLNSGIFEYPAKGAGEHPKAIYNIYEGVPYKAVKTRAGQSFHGFPCVSKRRDLSTRIYRQLLQRAEEQGVKSAIEKWFKEHP